MPLNHQTSAGQKNGVFARDYGGPWGPSPRGDQPAGESQHPNLEEILGRWQKNLKRMILGGGGSGGQFSLLAFIFFLTIILGVYILYSSYQVEADEVAVETVFGKPRDSVNEAGLHFAFWPIEYAEKVKIVERQVNIGSTGRSRQGLMLSGDQNIVDVAFSVLYSVYDPKAFLFNVNDPEGMLEDVAESAMREIVGRRPAQDIFRDDRQGISESVRAILQEKLDDYSAGITIRALNIEDVAPPSEVADAFDEVQRAEQNEDEFQEKANQYRNKELGIARGEGAQIREDAAAYKNRVVEEAKGEADRFLSVYEQYALSPEVTRKRLFLETMESVLAGSNKVIIENKETGVIPYLPLPEIRKQSKGSD
ncbi:FtsH protease activity modulator HflK [Candidatus Endowatersipora endosymbiont of Watersipora subatra]|uniref:FtsH protease activity modulator HflK n=1 Tax=Candidatus Endowatersipora endosymbiont of Watersipora subatra TaxID=3077946 RepID=UPI00312C99E2